MRGLVLLAGLVLPGAAFAQAKAGWGSVGKQEPQSFSWTRPLFDGFWMAWTPATLTFFVVIFCAILAMGLLEWWRPGGNPRHGAFGLETTRGDRLFISLLGSAWIFLAWLGLFSEPLWAPLAISAAWSAFVFARV